MNDFCVVKCTKDGECTSGTICNDYGWCERGGPGSGMPKCSIERQPARAVRPSMALSAGSANCHGTSDNLKIETVDGAAPYYSELLDDLELYDLASPPAPKLVYGGSWSHKNGQGMYNYQRSISSGGTGTTLKYTFMGTGLDILGSNDGVAKLKVTLDGQVTDASASTMATTEFCQTFALRNLANGSHTVQVKVLSGTLVADAVGVVAAPI